MFSLVFFKNYSQSVISGVINDEKGQPLSGATVIISKKTSTSILAYDISDTQGKFKTNVKDITGSLIFKVSYLGYTTWIKNIYNKKQQLLVQLFPSTENLKEVFVERKIIEQHGDTLSFSVAAFKDQKDRVIADVIKKMPGIEIMPSGAILYQGKPIQKYYIEGLDLMEGRYNLANENISADDVSKVQILENHQPLKILDSLVFSERSSLNIKLKKKLTISGNAELGAGFSPLLWKAKFTPMLFSKKRQAIVTYQSNNTGTDISRQIYNFSSENTGNNISIEKTNWLSITQLSKPPFLQELWLDNNVHLASVNVLQQIKKDVILKLNVSYLNDFQKQSGNSNTRFFTPTDTINLLENNQNKLFTSNLQSKLIIEKNTKSNYIKNNFEVNKYWNSKRGITQLTETSLEQNLSNPFIAIRNKLQLITTLGKQLIDFQSNIGYTKTNQDLEVTPGQFLNLLNNGKPYSKINQLLESTRLFADNSASLTKALKQFTIASKIGFSIQNQQLNSDLEVFENKQNTDLDFLNRLDFTTSKGYFENVIQFKSKDDFWKLRLKMPISMLHIKLEDQNYSNNRALNRLVFEPNFYLKKKLTAFWETSFTAGLNYNYGDVSRLYSGFMLTNYRNLNRYNAPISQQVNQIYRGAVSYRNPIKQIFINGAYSFSRTKNNLLYKNEIDENGAIILEAIENDNFINYNNYSLGGSKYFKKIKTTIKLNARYNQSNQEQLLNDTFTNVEKNNIHMDANLDTEIFSWLSLQYVAAISIYKSSFDEVQLRQVETNKHVLNLFFYLTDNQYLKCTNEYYRNSLSEKNSSNYFLNFSYQYTFKQSNIDLNLSWNNVLNTNEFVNVYTNEFTYVENSYKLRPSQVLASIKFSF
ncbi:carboxypeptidase-like regulatory domain-containing protein [Lutibacter flavus]|nr:carboxypeptidase-like regulatory domain-containing protein [Lutibacter flavus]